MTETHAPTCECEGCQRQAAGALAAAAQAELDNMVSREEAAALLAQSKAAGRLLYLALEELKALVREATGLEDKAAIQELMFAVLEASSLPSEEREALGQDGDIFSEWSEEFLRSYEQRADGDTAKVHVQAWRNDWASSVPRVWRRWREKNAARTGVRSFLANGIKPDDAKLAKMPEAEARLVDATEKQLAQIAEALGPLPTGADLERTTEKGDMLAVAEKHAACISRVFPQVATALKEDERARWATWQADPSGEPPWRRWEDRVFFAAMLAGRLWKTEIRGQLERLHEVLVPSVHPLPRKLILAARGGATFEPEKDGAGFAIIQEDGRGREVLPVPCALIAIGNGTQEGGLVASGRDLPALGPLVAWLAVKVHERWVNNEPRFDYVPMRMGRDALLRELGVELTEDEIDQALAWLTTFKIGGHPCVIGWDEKTDAAGSNGRPSKRRVIHVGAPFAPQGLVEVFKEAGVLLPRGLRFYSPVLRSDWAPLKGDQRTVGRQRDFFSLGLGAMLIDQRETYAQGGIRFAQAEWRRELDAMGIYHRSHHSLADNIWAALTTEPAQRQLDGPRHPVLVQPSPGRWVLSPDFEPQDRAIRLAAKETTDARARRKKHGA